MTSPLYHRLHLHWYLCLKVFLKVFELCKLPIWSRTPKNHLNLDYYLPKLQNHGDYPYHRIRSLSSETRQFDSSLLLFRPRKLKTVEYRHFLLYKEKAILKDSYCHPTYFQLYHIKLEHHPASAMN
ncbi:hypothetical protein D3C73_1392720 [compost metagenome]